MPGLGGAVVRGGQVSEHERWTMSVPCHTVLGPAAWGPTYICTGTGFDTLALNNANRSVGVIFEAPKSGQITHVGNEIRQIVGNPPAYNVGIVELDQWGDVTALDYGGSIHAAYDYAAAGWTWVALSTPATVTAGDKIAARLWSGAIAPDGGNHAIVGMSGIALGTGLLVGAIGTEYHLMPRGWYYRNFGIYIEGLPAGMAARYSDGQIIGLAATDDFLNYYHAGSTPDEVGCVFTLPFNVTCIGAHVPFEWVEGVGNQYEIRLYDAGGTVLASHVTLDADVEHADWLLGEVEVYWNTVSLLAKATYRLTIRALHVANRINPWGFTFDTATERACLPEGSRWMKTERTDLGAWTDTPEACPYFGVVVSSIM